MHVHQRAGDGLAEEVVKLDSDRHVAQARRAHSGGDHRFFPSCAPAEPPPAQLNGYPSAVAPSRGRRHVAA
jgi:hypothetical protein